MNPFFFGSSERPLYGVHHPPRERGPRESGVVLCYPMGQEYMRSHRAFRQLANLLTRKGHHVFRFDYFATGDSSGASGEGTFEMSLGPATIALVAQRIWMQARIFVPGQPRRYSSTTNALELTFGQS